MRYCDTTALCRVNKSCASKGGGSSVRLYACGLRSASLHVAAPAHMCMQPIPWRPAVRTQAAALHATPLHAGLPGKSHTPVAGIRACAPPRASLHGRSGSGCRRTLPPADAHAQPPTLNVLKASEATSKLGTSTLSKKRRKMASLFSMILHGDACTMHARLAGTRAPTVCAL